MGLGDDEHGGHRRKPGGAGRTAASYDGKGHKDPGPFSSGGGSIVPKVALMTVVGLVLYMSMPASGPVAAPEVARQPLSAVAPAKPIASPFLGAREDLELQDQLTGEDTEDEELIEERPNAEEGERDEPEGRNDELPLEDA
eukprot:6258069-Amphidinium_carterae.1